MKNKLLITETILRDAHQSQAATRMRTEDMLPALDKLDKIGYYSVECWGGATYDSCLRFLDEDPWERLHVLKEGMPNTKLQMLLRGQNLLGYKHYADDVVDFFVKKSIENGIDIIRIFDALNDIRNLEQAVKSCKKYKGICEAALSYTTSPVHNIDYFVNVSKKLEAMGADIICIKDMANLLLPYTAYDLVKAIKSAVKIPVHLHTHNTAGTGDMVYLKAAEAGVDIIDTALSPFANGTSQPCTESIVATLQGTDRDTGLDLAALNDVAKVFKPVADRLLKEGIINPKVLHADANALIYQVPGGMLSNLIKQLSDQNAADKLPDVLQEVPRVREDFGYPPLVTPTSQIVGTQAVLNVLKGERYAMVTKESKGLLRGEYGKLPAEPNPEVVQKCIGNDKRIECRPADMLKPEFEAYKKEMEKYYTCDEDVLSYCMFPQVSEKFFKAREEKHKRKLTVKVNGTEYNVEVYDSAYTAPKTAPAPQAAAPAAVQQPTPAPSAAPQAAGKGTPLLAPMPGTLLKYKVNNGATVKAGEAVLILEAMKMENEITAPTSGVFNYVAAEGSKLNTKDVIATIG